jgi:hypothetical protein
MTELLSLEERRGRTETLRRWKAAYQRAKGQIPEATAYFIVDLLDDVAQGDRVAADAVTWLLVPAMERFAEEPETYD